MTNQRLTPFTRRYIARLAEAALRDAGATDVFPTPMEAVQKTLGVRERVDISELPPELVAKKPSVVKRILGAMWFPERIVFIDGSQPEPRQLFTDGHEATHAMCDWHEEILQLDTEDTLFKEANDQIEAEANYGSSQLIFQGSRFHRRALEDQVSIRTPIALAPEYGASLHAALHYYVEEHPDPVALLIAGRYPRVDSTLPIWRTVESETFLAQFGKLDAKLPGGHLSIADSEDAVLAEIVCESRLAIDPPSKLIGIPDQGGTSRPFMAEAFFNGRCHFVLVSKKSARRLGRRVRLA